MFKKNTNMYNIEQNNKKSEKKKLAILTKILE